MDLLAGTQVGRYEILGPLGAGGMGEVYKALDTTLKREVAVKVLPSHVANNPDSLSRFEREALALAQLSHPNILAIHDFGRYKGVTFAATELLEGGTLRSRIDRGALSVRSAIEIAASVSDGLGAAHSKGIIHRDLKPENIFLTADHQVKILDFGLARIDMTAVPTSGNSETSVPTETDPSVVKGTVGYMSPEHLRGRPVDARSDIFSLGCVFFEMLTGNRAFGRATAADTITAILKDDPDDVYQSGRQIPQATEKILLHCLEKDPETRVQSARDLALHLRTIVSSPEISEPTLRPSPTARHPYLWLSTMLIVVLVVAISWFTLFRNSPTSTQKSKPSVAVLYFENDTGDQSLDWLRSALTNMLVTDLSQSTQIEVLGTDHLYQILKDLDQLDEPTISSDLVAEVARRARVNTVLLGSFVKAGDNFRIFTRLQDAESGRILSTERVEGIGESAIFEMVDDMTRRIKTTLEVTVVSEDPLDRGIEEVTTSSVEAYRHFVSGERFHNQSKEREAIKELEMAVNLDPDFAMALAKLSVSHWNLGHVRKAHKFAEQALEQVDRLTARERYYIEGRYYSLKPESYSKAIEAYERAISLYPDHSAARHNLANLYQGFERYEEAIAHLEEVRRRGSSFAGSHTNLANAYAAFGEYEKGLAVIEEFVAKYPDNGVAHRDLGSYLAFGGRHQEALEAFNKAELLSPNDLEILRGRWVVRILQENWSEAEAVVNRALQSEDPYRKFAGRTMGAQLKVYRGDPVGALEELNQAAKIFPDQGPFLAAVSVQKASIFLEQGHFEAALRESREARAVGQGYPVEGDAMALAALAHSNLGNQQGAEAVRNQWRDVFKGVPEEVAERVNNMFAGCFALAEDNRSLAVQKLNAAESSLPRGGLPGWQPIQIWYNLGIANRELGNRSESAKWFNRISDSTVERLGVPIPFVRSLYFLGEYHLEEGNPEEARKYFSRFLNHWGEGSLDPDRVIRARSILED